RVSVPAMGNSAPDGCRIPPRKIPTGFSGVWIPQVAGYDRDGAKSIRLRGGSANSTRTTAGTGRRGCFAVVVLESYGAADNDRIGCGPGGDPASHTARAGIT